MAKSFIRSKEWKSLRDQIISRDGHECFICHAKDKLIVHHILYRRGHKEYQSTKENLITLCRSCHYKVHKLDWSLILFKFLMEKCQKQFNWLISRIPTF